MAAARQPAVAVIDVGKTRIRLAAIDREGVVLDSASAASRSAGGALDADAAWSWFCSELPPLAARFDLSAIVPTTHGAAAAIVGDGDDGIGPPLFPIRDYEALPPADIDADYDALRPRFAETFSPRLPAGLNLGRQLYWAQRAEGSAWRSARAVLAYPQYWSWRLTGRMASEVTALGCHTDLWAPLEKRLSSLVDAQGWRGLFPLRRPAWESLGRLRPALNLPAECCVLNGIHDSNAAYLRYLAGVTGPFTLLSTGTWMVCFNSAGRIDALDPARDTLANVDVFGRPIACSRFMGGREYAAVAGAAGLVVAPTLDDVKAVLARRLFALPSFSTSGGPYPGRAGTCTGEPATAREAAALAALYTALMARESILLTGPVSNLYIDGAFAANDAFTGALAALLPEVEVHVALGTDGTAIGASLLAAMQANGGSLPRVDVPARRVDTPGLDIAGYAAEWRRHVQDRA